MKSAVSAAIAEHRDGAVLAVSVVARSGLTALDRIEAGALRIRVAAPPVAGAANAALIHYLADRLDVPRGSVRLVGGETGRRKRVLVAGLSSDELARRIVSLMPTS